ncbi:MAG: TfoX/Sxy family protein [Gammaproteobacteria bacterium]|nr:TfoX/Sxy family protein [Gammaproteobacteria bacterium]
MADIAPDCSARPASVAYDEVLAERVRAVLAGRSDIVEKKMFGGLAFMVSGNMCCGVSKGDLVVRVGPAAYAAALAEKHVREMDFTGKPLRGFVYVARKAIASDEQLQAWLGRGVEFATSLPAK